MLISIFLLVSNLMSTLSKKTVLSRYTVGIWSHHLRVKLAGFDYVRFCTVKGFKFCMCCKNFNSFWPSLSHWEFLAFDNKILTFGCCCCCCCCSLHIYKESLQKNRKLTHVPLQSSQVNKTVLLVVTYWSLVWPTAFTDIRIRQKCYAVLLDYR